jgi:hypothetical protein
LNNKFLFFYSSIFNLIILIYSKIDYPDVQRITVQLNNNINSSLANSNPTAAAVMASSSSSSMKSAGSQMAQQPSTAFPAASMHSQNQNALPNQMGAPSANNNSAATKVRMEGQQMQQRLFGTPNSPQKQQQIHQHQHQFVFHRFPAPPAPSAIGTATGDFEFRFAKLHVSKNFFLFCIF